MSDAPKIRRLIWDIETSPCLGFFWRPGYKVRIPHDNIVQESAIICICYKWEGEDDVYYLTWDDGDDRDMVEAFLDVANTADELIAHNGDKFDLKWFNARVVKHGLEPPPIWKTVDTLVIARRRFNFNSNRLDYLGKHLLGEGKSDTGGFGLWKEIVMNGCQESLDKMVDYCIQDVVLLEKVWKKLAPFHNPKTHVGVLNGDEKWTCARCGSAKVRLNKIYYSTAGTPKQRMYCRGCHGYYSISWKDREDFLLWRQKQKLKKNG